MNDGGVLQYEVVGYAPRSPRDWYIHPSPGQAGTEQLAAPLLGPGTIYRGTRPAATLVNRTDLVGITMFGPVIIVMWSGRPESALNWDQLNHDPRCQRFRVGVYPASDGMEAEWTSADGEIRRHVSISGGEIVVDHGETRVFDEDADTDNTLEIDWDNRLPKSITSALLNDAGPGEIETYDGRRYVLTADPSVWKRARIVRRGPKRSRWVAVDQTGPINTLRDPLAKPVPATDPDELGADVLETWFLFRPDADADDLLVPPMHTYSWPDDPKYRSLVDAMKRIRQDQAGYFTLVGDSDSNTVADRIAERYQLHLKDVLALLEEPLNTLIKPAGVTRCSTLAVIASRGSVLVCSGCQPLYRSTAMYLGRTGTPRTRESTPTLSRRK